MKRNVLLLVAAALLLAGCAASSHPAAAETGAPTTPAPQTPIPQELPKQEPEEGLPNAVDLYFPSNPTTGNDWTATVETPGVVELDEQYFPKQIEGLVGAGGTQWYRIRGVGEGITSVTFQYGRYWEEKPLTTFVYRLQVDARGSVLIWGVEVSN